MIATRLSRPSQPACWNASHIEPSAISESPHRHQTRYGRRSSRAPAIATPTRDRQALAERAGGDVGRRDPRRRVALEPRAEPAERQQLLVVDDPGRLQHRVVERRRVALGEDQVVGARGRRGSTGRAAGGRRSAPPAGRRRTSTRSGGRSRRRRWSGPSPRAAAAPAPAGSRSARPWLCGHQLVALRLEVGEQLAERLGELLDALALERRRRRRRSRPRPPRRPRGCGGRRRRRGRSCARRRRGPGTPRSSRAASC